MFIIVFIIMFIITTIVIPTTVVVVVVVVLNGASWCCLENETEVGYSQYGPTDTLPSVWLVMSGRLISRRRTIEINTSLESS